MCKSIQMISSISLFLLLLYCDNGYSLCANKTALYAVNATVYPDIRSKGFSVSENFYLLENFAVIHVFQANVTDLCEGMVKNFPKLEILSLINVNLSKIQPNSLQKLNRLRELSLAVNYLTEIVQGVFNNLAALETLYLSSNQISFIQENSFANMPNLKSIHLDRNKMATINGNLFGGCPKIGTVDFRFNQIESIGRYSFADIKPASTNHIKILLNQNLISDIDRGSFEEINPVVLHLENNRLNGLTTITELFEGVKELSKIYLNKNQFSCVPDNIILNMRNTIKDLSVLDNPLSCECMDKIRELIGEELYGKGQLYYNSTFPCDSLKQFGPWE